MQYDVVIVGAGNAGICAAAAMAQNGLKTLVLEQHNLPGGCASSFKRGRFEFDVSLHSVDYEASFKPVFKGLMGLQTDFLPMPQAFDNIYVENGKIIREHYDLTGDMIAQLNKNHPGCGEIYAEIIDVFKEAAAAFKMVMAPNADMKAIAMQYPLFAKYGSMTLDQLFDAFHAPLYLKNLMCQYWWYVGQKPEKFPLTVYAPLSTNFFNVRSFPEETAHGYLAELESIIRKNGGDIWYNTAATKINTVNNIVTSVETSQGDKIDTHMVVCNCDPRSIMGELVDGCDKIRNSFLEQEKNVKENFSFFSIYVGLDASAEELGIKDHHTHITEVLDQNEIYDAMSSWDGPRTIGVLCQNITVKDYSPKGTCALSISVPVQGSLMEGLSQKEYVQKKRHFEMDIIEKVEKYLGVELKSHIEEIDTATPVTLARYAKMYNGALGNMIDTTSLGKIQQLSSMINKQQTVKGLFVTGQFSMIAGYQNTVSGYMFGRQLASMKKGDK